MAEGFPEGFLKIAERLKLLYAKRAIYARLQEILETENGCKQVGLAAIDQGAVLEVLADLDSRCIALVVNEIGVIEESSVYPSEAQERPKKRKVRVKKKKEVTGARKRKTNKKAAQ